MFLEETFGLRVIQNLLNKGRSQDSSVGIVTKIRAATTEESWSDFRQRARGYFFSTVFLSGLSPIQPPIYGYRGE
jgi:hypothetical protein